jgi:hypothetical protein
VVTAAAQRTTAENSLIPLPIEDYWYYLNAVLNELAEQFAVGPPKHDLNLEVRCARICCA